MTPSDDVLKRSRTAAAVARNRKLQLGFGLFFAIGALGAAAAVVVTATESKPDWVVLLFTVASALIGAVLLRAFWGNRNVLRSPLLSLIRERPEAIVWIYVEDQQQGGASVHKTVHVKAASKAFFVLYSLQPEQVQDELAAWCPQAYVGWSKAAEQAYAKDPSSVAQLPRAQQAAP